MKIKYVELFEYATFSFGIFLCLTGLWGQLWLLVALGGFIVVMSVGTIFHVVSGKHNRFSKLPPDFKVKP